MKALHQIMTNFLLQIQNSYCFLVWSTSEKFSLAISSNFLEKWMYEGYFLNSLSYFYVSFEGYLM